MTSTRLLEIELVYDQEQDFYDQCLEDAIERWVKDMMT